LDNVLDFFREKKPWSKYKDLILDYYLEPYLHKVKTLGKPILIVDCFAGPGKFGDGLLGSPLIISERLRPLYERGANVLGLYIEKDAELYNQLEANTRDSRVPVETRSGDFRDQVDEIVDLARHNTVFIYVDPIKPSDLFFDDLGSVYARLKGGSSVETLINFMSAGFLRAVTGVQHLIAPDGVVQTDHEIVLRWNDVAGGEYWHEIAFTPSLSAGGRTDMLAQGYATELKRWFDFVIPFPIRAKYEQVPKYHMVFGSGHPDGIELMNTAMVKARRELVTSEFVVGRLFPDEPEREVIDPEEVKRIVIETSRQSGKTTWKMLRVYSTMNYPCMYNKTDFNRAIKGLIRDGRLASDCPGTKIQENALIWTLP